MESNNGFLNGQKVVVIGASSGIGLATAKAAALEGAEVIIASGNEQRITTALKQLPAKASSYTLDAGDEEAIKAFFNNISHIDHLVYTAGENISLNNLNETDLTIAKQFFTVRYWGALAAVKYAAPLINKGGSISLMSGIASARPGKGWGIASAICGAMEGFTRAMAVELAPIRVNCVAPGVVKTNLWNGIPEDDRQNFVENAYRLRDALNCEKVVEIIPKESSGSAHCQIDDFTKTFNMYDWIEKKMKN